MAIKGHFETMDTSRAWSLGDCMKILSLRLVLLHNVLQTDNISINANSDNINTILMLNNQKILVVISVKLLILVVAFSGSVTQLDVVCEKIIITNPWMTRLPEPCEISSPERVPPLKPLLMD